MTKAIDETLDETALNQAALLSAIHAFVDAGPNNHVNSLQMAAGIRAYLSAARRSPLAASVPVTVKGLERAWTDFLDANPDDLSSPEDLPDHALMTGDQFVKYALSALSSLPASAVGVETCPVLSEELVEQAWSDLLNVDDRTSPEEYPDMALIKFEELRGILSGFVSLARKSTRALPDSSAAAGGYVIANGSGLIKWRTFENGIPAWTDNRDDAIWYVRRRDAELAAEEDEDAWLIQEVAPVPSTALLEALEQASRGCRTYANTLRGAFASRYEIADYLDMQAAQIDAALAVHGREG